MPEILKIDPRNPDKALITEAVEILRGGGIIAYPTETFYGLGADGCNDEAVEKIFLIKGRDIKNPVSVIIGGRDDLRGIVQDIPDRALSLMERFWPGALTIVFSASANVSPLLTAGTGKIGVRISSHPIATALAGTLGRPLTATSANPSGGKVCTSAQEVMESIGDQIDVIIDGGETPGGKGSTILDVTADPPVILREGAIPASVILYITT